MPTVSMADRTGKVLSSRAIASDALTRVGSTTDLTKYVGEFVSSRLPAELSSANLKELADGKTAIRVSWG